MHNPQFPPHTHVCVHVCVHVHVHERAHVREHLHEIYVQSALFQQ